MLFVLLLVSFATLMGLGRLLQISHDAAARAGTLAQATAPVRHAHLIVLGIFGSYVLLGGAWLQCWCAELEAEGVARRAQEDADRRREEAAASARDRAEAERRAADEKKKAEEAAQARAVDLAQLKQMKPWERMSALRKCFAKDLDCPYAVELILEAAGNKVERQQLEAQKKGFERVRALANRPLLCNDGTESPSCTCGRPRRGCCSHHGGVQGCAPLESE